MTGEKNLWCAVISQTLKDIEAQLRLIKSARNRKDQKGMNRALRDLAALERLTQHEWFLDVCDFSNIHLDTFKQRRRFLYVKHKLGELLKGYQ